MATFGKTKSPGVDFLTSKPGDGSGGTTIVGMSNPATDPLEMGSFPINTNGTVDGRDLSVDGTNLDALQTAVGIAPGQTVLPALPAGAGAVIPAANLVAQLTALKILADAGGGNAVATVAGVTPTAGGDVSVTALLTALDAAPNTNFLTDAERAQIAAVVADQHTHTNKAILDTLDTADQANIDALVANPPHSHTNKAILDAITAQGSGAIITSGERALLAPATGGNAGAAGTAGHMLAMPQGDPADYIGRDLVPRALPAASANFDIIDAKGDLIAGTADNAAARLPVGTDNQELIANAATASGLEWVNGEGFAPAGEYNATTNTPNLNLAASQVNPRSKNLIYIVSAAGTVTIPGLTARPVAIGDLLIFIGSGRGFAHVPSTSAVLDVFDGTTQINDDGSVARMDFAENRFAITKTATGQVNVDLAASAAPVVHNENLPQILDGDSYTFTAAFPGAILGESFIASPTVDIGNVSISAYATSAGNVEVTLQNSINADIAALGATNFNIRKIDGLQPGLGTAGVNSVGQGAGILITGTATDPVVAANVGTGANQLVQLDPAGALPAVDGSNLTGVGSEIPGTLAQRLRYLADGSAEAFTERRKATAMIPAGKTGRVFSHTPDHDFTLEPFLVDAPDNAWTFDVTINGTPVGGMAGVTVNAAAQTTITPTSAFAGTAGQTIEVSISANSVTTDSNLQVRFLETGLQA